MTIDEKELFLAHTLDVAWIIALWHWIHGGDPLQDSEAAQTTELIARGLVGHLGRGNSEVPNDIVEKMSQLGIKLVVKSGDQRTEVKSTKQLHEHYTQKQGSNLPIPCLIILGGHEVCWSPVFWPQVPLKR